MSKIAKIILLGGLFCCLIVTELKAAGLRLSIDSIRVESGYVVTNIYADGLLDKKMIDGLERGFSSVVQYRIQFWRKKRLMSQIVAERYYEVRLFYDVWNRKYIYEMPIERGSTIVIEKVRTACSEIKSIPLAPVEKVAPDAEYFISVELKFEPISTEKYEELRTWLSGNSDGEVKTDVEPKSSQARKPGKGRFFAILTNLIGLGDKIVNVKSKNFRFSESQKVIFVPD